MFWNTDDIKRSNDRAGNHFFEPASMRFFRSRVLPHVYGGRYFVTSERFVASDGTSPGRRYTVRIANDDGTIDTASAFQQYGTARAAQKAADKLAREYITSRSTAPTANGNDLDIFNAWSRKYANA